MVVENRSRTATGDAQEREGHPSAAEQQGRVRDQGMTENLSPSNPASHMTATEVAMKTAQASLTMKIWAIKIEAYHAGKSDFLERLREMDDELHNHKQMPEWRPRDTRSVLQRNASNTVQIRRPPGIVAKKD